MTAAAGAWCARASVLALLPGVVGAEDHDGFQPRAGGPGEQRRGPQRLVALAVGAATPRRRARSASDRVVARHVCDGCLRAPSSGEAAGAPARRRPACLGVGCRCQRRTGGPWRPPPDTPCSRAYAAVSSGALSPPMNRTSAEGEQQRREQREDPVVRQRGRTYPSCRRPCNGGPPGVQRADRRITRVVDHPPKRPAAAASRPADRLMRRAIRSRAPGRPPPSGTRH